MRTGPRSSTTMDVSRDKLPKDLVVLNQLDDGANQFTGQCKHNLLDFNTHLIIITYRL